ncbi:hypothetical protein G5C66_06620 [Nocardioides sp. KC13]|uniref:Heavy-metal-associated domain-containing protein n=1 Tax=Nocardioides turkmenicus TaxID=2711220 RepID=A0A6M1QRI2_9ACTN|nr:hypothetical protein [Nocardioides sp. KC13]NGN92415.1 hypothetical protein [Nocardioides sp. KC13]
MNAIAKVGAFAGAVVALGGLGSAVGASVGPIGEPERPSHQEHGKAGGHGGHAGHGATKAPAATGLNVSEAGYTLDLVEDRYQRTADATLRFRILGDDHEPVTRFETAHGKKLHLIVVRRDLATFQHVHPVMAADGTWSVGADLAEAGTYRVFADFKPKGADEGLTLGQDLFVAGPYEPQPLPAAAATSAVSPYQVDLDGHLVAGKTSRLTLTVTKDGEPVTDLEPYLEAYGHLVALRDGDLAYLHVHPEGAPGDGRTEPGPEITFSAEVPSAGTYRLFLDFQHAGEVRTAAFTAVAEAH